MYMWRLANTAATNSVLQMGIREYVGCVKLGEGCVLNAMRW